MSAKPTAPERAAANAIYDVLVEWAGAPDTDSKRRQFEAFYPKHTSLGEFRFGGLLGFSGKIWWTSYRG
jgi:hypothetical protein